jgi:hypothetical protein
VDLRRETLEQVKFAVMCSGEDHQRHVTQRPDAASERRTGSAVDAAADRVRPGSPQLGRQRLRPQGE